jgi:hypothetical protein
VQLKSSKDWSEDEKKALSFIVGGDSFLYTRPKFLFVQKLQGYKPEK